MELSFYKTHIQKPYQIVLGDLGFRITMQLATYSYATRI
jgi:hypothetical protein